MNYLVRVLLLMTITLAPIAHATRSGDALRAGLYRAATNGPIFVAAAIAPVLSLGTVVLSFSAGAVSAHYYFGDLPNRFLSNLDVVVGAGIILLLSSAHITATEEINRRGTRLNSIIKNIEDSRHQLKEPNKALERREQELQVKWAIHHHSMLSNCSKLCAKKP